MRIIASYLRDFFTKKVVFTTFFTIIEAIFVVFYLFGAKLLEKYAESYEKSDFFFFKKLRSVFFIF